MMEPMMKEDKLIILAWPSAPVNMDNTRSRSLPKKLLVCDLLSEMKLEVAASLVRSLARSLASRLGSSPSLGWAATCCLGWAWVSWWEEGATARSTAWLGKEPGGAG